MSGWDAFSEEMRTARTRAPRRPRHIGRRAAEQLLTGGPIGADRRALAEMLSKAAGPARRHEMRGKDAVVAAFVQASGHHVPLPIRPRRHPVLVPPLTKALSVKVAAVMAALVFGGVAWAAGAGSLPSPVQQVAHDVFSVVGVPPPERQDPGGTGRDEDEQTDEDEPSDAKSAGTAEPSDDPDEAETAELCRAYRAEREHGGEPMDPASRRRLVAAAGNEAKVDLYCAKILAEEEDRDSPAETTEPNPNPNGTPSAVATDDGPTETNPNAGPHS